MSVCLQCMMAAAPPPYTEYAAQQGNPPPVNPSYPAGGYQPYPPAGGYVDPSKGAQTGYAGYVQQPQPGYPQPAQYPAQPVMAAPPVQQPQAQQQTIVITQGTVATGNCPICRVVWFLCCILHYTVLWLVLCYILLQCYYYYYNHFMALWTMSGTTQVSQYHKVHFAIFWIFWCKMKITQADAATIRMDWHPIQTNWCSYGPTSTIPIIFTLDALPDTTLPIYPDLGQAPNMLACIPSGLVSLLYTRHILQ